MLNKKHTNTVPQDLLPDAFNDFLAMLMHSWLNIFRIMIHLIGQCLNVFISSNSVKFNPNLFISYHPFPLKTNPEGLHMDAKLLRLGAADVVTPVLCNIFGHSIKEARVYGDFKLARVTPIYTNKGSQIECIN